MTGIFLGGTIAGPDYRELLIPLLKVPYFNPVVDNWTEADAVRENIAKQAAAINVFVITPAAIGMYSVAEMTELAITSDKPLYVMFMEVEGYSWNEHQVKSNTQIKKLLSKYNVLLFEDLPLLANALNWASVK